MDDVREGYQGVYEGDDALVRRLAAAGSPYDVAGLRSLCAGVAAAPPALDPDSWMVLAASSPPPELKAQLQAFAAMQRSAREASGHAPEPSSVRLGRLRSELARQGVAGFLVPRADEHQGEYVPACAGRLAWLTGFSGSAGIAVVLAERAAVFVDGRYTLQAQAEVDGSLYALRHLTEEPATDWIAENLQHGAVLGYDPWLLTPGQLERYRAAAERAGGTMQALAANPVDAVWTDRPPPPLAPVAAHALSFAGKSSEEKRREIAAALAKSGQDAAILAAPDSIAWLLNIRGGDVPHTPLALGFAILRADASVDFFTDPRKLVPGLAAELGGAVRIAAPSDFGPALDRLGGKRVQADPSGAASWIFERLTAAGAQMLSAADPCQLPKACKNPVELDGARAAHRRDGAALTRFLAWLAGASGAGDLTEIAVSDRLEEFRRPGEYFRDLSFPTISGAGPNGAIVHYHATPRTERRLEPGNLYLVDSGAQYLDGTTDVTRTVAIGTPSPEMRDRFTRVLKGHIALALCRFPRGTSGAQLDVLARHSLWEVGLDYDHGTGHGVGSYLGVHEGPQRISKLPSAQALVPGMIVSNEPGYYKTDAYGIRIENLVVVTAPEMPAGGERELLGFETLTLAPIDRALIDPALLDPAELSWLDAYHARVREALAPLLDADTASWLAAATLPVA